MENKLQQLTQKLYDEGLEKGRAEAERLVSEAKSEAAKIIADAKAEAEAIVKALGVGKAVQNSNTYLFEEDFLIVLGADWK